ncbi:MAG: hypothetical protein K9K67_07040 [Bacteriovoracaceae bacterium]|nr:hypothetical protein [Bacteriovoracaceae bacterium]
MNGLLYIIRINGALVLGLAMAIILSGPFPSEGPKRSLASVNDEGCANALRAHLRQNRQYFQNGVPLKSVVPNYDQEIEKIDRQLFTVKSFVNSFQKRTGRYPTYREVLDKIIRGHQDLVRSILNLGSHGEDIAYFVDETVKSLNFTPKEKENILAFVRENPELLGKVFEPQNSDLTRTLDGLWKNPYGDYGELLAALHFPGVEAQNLHLRSFKISAIGPKVDFHQNNIVAATTRAFERIENSGPEELQRLKERFPRVFSEQRADDLEAIKTWLESKEVDLITKGRNDNRFYFLEIKNYNKLTTHEVLVNGYRGSKSVFTQQQEMREILEFLELDGTYFAAISFLKGIDEEGRRALEQEGIIVVPFE